MHAAQATVQRHWCSCETAAWPWRRQQPSLATEARAGTGAAAWEPSGRAACPACGGSYTSGTTCRTSGSPPGCCASLRQRRRAWLHAHGTATARSCSSGPPTRCRARGRHGDDVSGGKRGCAGASACRCGTDGRGGMPALKGAFAAAAGGGACRARGVRRWRAAAAGGGRAAVAGGGRAGGQRGRAIPIPPTC